MVQWKGLGWHVTEDISVPPVFLFLCVLSCVDASRPLPEFVDMVLEDQTLPDGILLEHLKAFQTLYREHCEVGSCGLLVNNVNGHVHDFIALANSTVFGQLDWFMNLRNLGVNMLFSPQAILDVMVNLQFTLVETLWKSFWRFSQSNDTDSVNLYVSKTHKRVW